MKTEIIAHLDNRGAMGLFGSKALEAPAPGTGARKAPEVWVVHSEIGGGKTTLVRMMAALLRRLGLRVCVIFEPSPLWEKDGSLKMLYADPVRNAAKFQAHAHVSRLRAIVAAIRAMPDADVYLLERDPTDDKYIFVEVMREVMGEEAVAIYTEFHDVHTELLDLLPVNLSTARHLYLKPTLAACMARTEKRARAGEVATTDAKTGTTPTKAGVTLEYQQRLRRPHEALFEGKHAGEYKYERPFPLERVQVIETDEDFTENNLHSEQVLIGILARLGYTIPSEPPTPASEAVTSIAQLSETAVTAPDATATASRP